MNIRTKIQLFSTVWLMVIMLVINISIYVLFHNITIGEELNRLRLQTDRIAEAVNPAAGQVNHTDLLRAYLPADGMIRIIDKQSDPIAVVTKEEVYSKMTPEFKSIESAGMIKFDQRNYAVSYFPLIWSDGNLVTLEVTENAATAYESLGILKLVLLISYLVILIPSVLAGRLLSNIILKPINAMIHTMEEIERKGHFKKINLMKQSNDELYKLGNTFNKMMDILAVNFEKQQQFVSDASHELKTPLTVIESYASLLKRWGTKKPDVLEESIEAIHSEAVRMKEMTNQMLMLANHHEEWNLKKENTELVSLSRDTGKMIKRVYNRFVKLEHEQPEIFAAVDRNKIKQLLVILLDNALKYSSSAIELHVGSNSDGVYITVKDYGSGIPKEELSHIFDRFYRIDKARSRQSGGSGLGLAIAKKIVEAHGGQIRVISEEGYYTAFTASFPP